jgi:hypothetical protein
LPAFEGSHGVPTADKKANDEVDAKDFHQSSLLA